MVTRSRLGAAERERLMAELERLHGGPSAPYRHVYYRVKRWAWVLAIQVAGGFKRVMDVIVAFLVLTLLSPLMLLLALFIRWTDGGPSIQTTTRTGRWGKEFQLPMFRCLRVNADQIRQVQSDIAYGGAIAGTMRKDPRITWIGAIMLKLGLEQLPRIWCVLRGDMSLVGPRPPMPEEVVRYTLVERRRLDVRPGLTGLWQINGCLATSFQKQVELDLQYIQSQSLWLDLKILAKTILAVIMGRGVY